MKAFTYYSTTVYIYFNKPCSTAELNKSCNFFHKYNYNFVAPDHFKVIYKQKMYNYEKNNFIGFNIGPKSTNQC